MDEPTQPYHEVRALLENLVASWPWDRPGTAFENAKVYLDFHCADCGAKLGVNDLAVVLELEMLRLGTVDARRVPSFDPICVRCYLRRAAPACHAFPAPLARTAGGDARYRANAQSVDAGALHASADTIRAPTMHNPARPKAKHLMPLGSSPLQHTPQPARSRQPIQRPWWWRYAGECLLGVALLLIVLALGIALNNVPWQAHTSTLTRPTAPVAPTTAAPTSPSGRSSFRVGTARRCDRPDRQRAERLLRCIPMEA
jgi:hypothetical protein